MYHRTVPYQPPRTHPSPSQKNAGRKEKMRLPSRAFPLYIGRRETEQQRLMFKDFRQATSLGMPG